MYRDRTKTLNDNVWVNEILAFFIEMVHLNEILNDLPYGDLTTKNEPVPSAPFISEAENIFFIFIFFIYVAEKFPYIVPFKKYFLATFSMTSTYKLQICDARSNYSKCYGL